MKKILAVLLVIFISCQLAVFAGAFEGNFLDPFDNSLFEVVAETECYDDFYLEFYYRDKVYNEDYSLSKVVETTINYDGSYEKKDLCDFLPNGEADAYYFTDDYIYAETPEFNDGLKHFSDFENYAFGLKDINDNSVYESYTLDYFGFDYNLGILSESENNGYADPNMSVSEREFKTTFTTIMTDNSKYEFNCAIGTFNDDGYALMRLNGKMYIVKLRKGVIPTVFYNNEKIYFDQIPVIENGRTLVPLRAIFETFGAEVTWDGATSTVTAVKDGTEVKLTIDNPTAYKNGEAIELDVPAKIINGRTLVPVRFVSDCFDVLVNWDGTMMRVDLTK